MPASMWKDVLDVLGEEFRDEVSAETEGTLSRAVDKRAIKAAIETGIEVPGATLIAGKTTLGRK